ncbi:MAG: serine/threonine-protein kinase [Candidatus Obscuribacterales bacterium]
MKDADQETDVKICADCSLPYSEVASHACSPLPAAIADPYINLVINGRFRIEEPVGIGGWSMVYRARDEKLQRLVAVKLLHLPLASDQEKRRRFENEARAASRLSHPNIVATYDYGLTPMGQPYIVMEHLEGETLADRLKRSGKLSPAQAVEIFKQAAEGLAYAHFRGLVHRDIKPSNLFITEGTVGGCTVKIVDFGLAKSLGPAGEISEITSTGQTIGSPAYMSPEQCLGEKLDGRSDVYSLTCSLFESMAGVKPFAGNPMECMSGHVGGPVPTFDGTDAADTVPPELQAAVSKGLAKRREERFQSALDFRDSIGAGIKGQCPRVPGWQRLLRKLNSPQCKWMRIALRAIVYGALALVVYFEFAEPLIMVNLMGMQEVTPRIKSDQELAYVADGMESHEGGESAREFLEQALDYRMAKFGALSAHAGAAAFLLADLYDRQKKPELAFYYLKYASQCLSTGHDTALYADCLTRLAEVSSATGHLSIALKAAEDLEVMEKRQYGENSQQLQAAREVKRDVLQKIETENPALLKPLATQSSEKGGKRSVKRHAQ